MRDLTIQAASLRSARRIQAALEGFNPELIAEPGRYWVSVDLRGCDVAAVLSALQHHVAERDNGPAVVDLDGQRYRVEAT
jgi:hypothetical protein